MFFSQETAESIRPYWWMFLMVGLGIASWQAWPRLRRHYKLNGRDVTIELVVGDIFSGPGDLVVGSNTTFDTDTQDGLISHTSIQGIFSDRYFSSRSDLDALLDSQLDTLAAEEVTKKGKTKRYPMGTVCRVAVSGHSSYWLAIADLNEHGNARGTFQNLRDALPRLWDHISQRGSRGPLRMPVLGSGFSRLPEPRERIIKEIIRSFIAACSECTFCDRLLIYIHPDDYRKHKLDLEDLDRFLQYQCLYTDLASPDTIGQGTGIG